MAIWAEKIGRALNCDEKEIEIIHWAALLHDIGKIGVPDNILLKPSTLNPDEYRIIQKHPGIGARIIAPVKKLVAIAPAIRGHQEKYDGTGYPDGLKGDQIPLAARILAVVDSYVAITDNRVYREARSHQEAIDELQMLSGKHYDPQVVDIFVNLNGPEGPH